MWLSYLLAYPMESAFVLGTLGNCSVEVVPCFLEDGNKLVSVFAFLMKGFFCASILPLSWSYFFFLCSKYIPSAIICAWNRIDLPFLQVFTFGSVPLKTYLPDGDIDVTAFSNSDELKDTWENLVRDALEQEGKNENAEFCVKEVQYIQAEVVSL